MTQTWPIRTQYLVARTMNNPWSIFPGTFLVNRERGCINLWELLASWLGWVRTGPSRRTRGRGLHGECPVNTGGGAKSYPLPPSTLSLTQHNMASQGACLWCLPPETCPFFVSTACPGCRLHSPLQLQQTSFSFWLKEKKVLCVILGHAACHASSNSTEACQHFRLCIKSGILLIVLLGEGLETIGFRLFAFH